MAARHHRPPPNNNPRNVDAGARPSRPAADRIAATPVADRSLSALHPPDPGEVPDAGRQPALRDGVSARLRRQPPSLSASHRMPATASEGRGVFALAQPAGRTGPG